MVVVVVAAIVVIVVVVVVSISITLTPLGSFHSTRHKHRRLNHHQQQHHNHRLRLQQDIALASLKDQFHSKTTMMMMMMRSFASSDAHRLNDGSQSFASSLALFHYTPSSYSFWTNTSSSSPSSSCANAASSLELTYVLSDRSQQ